MCQAEGNEGAGRMCRKLSVAEILDLSNPIALGDSDLVTEIFIPALAAGQSFWSNRVLSLTSPPLHSPPLPSPM